MTMAQIKSRKRVKDFAEVFTAEREVKAMCDLIPPEQWTIESTFLEPACGNGNFLVEIYARKLELCKNEKDGLKALASIVGIDIQADNCEESRKRLFDMYCEKFANCNSFCKAMAERILQNNIICGDSLQIMKNWEDKK
jgi:ubiquinone/menaquinone biosynthesis C-methylase UbiE